MKKILFALVVFLAASVFAENIVSPENTMSGATINGRVTNSVNGTGLQGAQVQIAGLTTVTDASGNYEISGIPEAVLTARFSGSPVSGTAPLTVNFTDQSTDAAHVLVVTASGYSTYTNSHVVIADGETLTMDVSLSPTISAGELRIVLNWGEYPHDLDSFLKTPPIEGNEYTVYYSSRGDSASPPYATLDHDDQDGYGPETITIYQRASGTYKYYVHQYSSTGTLITSNAVVQVYDASGLIASVNVPTEGDGRYWNVLTIDGATGDITIINEILDTAPSKLLVFPGEKKNEVAVNLNVKSSKDITSWLWNFGDGTTSTEQNPSHTYTSAGTYTVTLTVDNGTTENTETKTDYINVTGGAVTGTILQENFDGDVFPPAGWTQTSTQVDYTWQKGNPTDHPFSGIDATSVYSAICPWVAQNQEERLFSRSFNIGNGNATLTFWAGYSTNWLSQATVKLKITTDNGNNWTQIWEAENDGGSWEWREFTIDLSSYKNHDGIIMQWVYIGNDGDLVGIDNVLIEGTLSDVNDSGEALRGFSLSQNYPNPFSKSAQGKAATSINYSIPNANFVTINVYNTLGQNVATLINQNQNRGNYSVTFESENLPTGIYFYTIKAGNFTQTKKMLLIK